MPKIISNTKGITLDKDGQPQVDNSFEGPAYVVQDMGLGIEEKVITQFIMVVGYMNHDMG